MTGPRAGAAGVAALLLTAMLAAPACAAGIADLQQGIEWGESSRALLGHLGASATVVSPPIDFGDSYAAIVRRDVQVGGVPMIAFFQMDKATGGLKRIQLERQRHGANPPAFRAIFAALQAEFGAPDAACTLPPSAANGYQAGAEGVWRRDNIEVRVVFRHTTLEALEGCLGGNLGMRVCGLTGQLILRVARPAPAQAIRHGSRGCGEEDR